MHGQQNIKKKKEKKKEEFIFFSSMKMGSMKFNLRDRNAVPAGSVHFLIPHMALECQSVLSHRHASQQGNNWEKVSADNRELSLAARSRPIRCAVIEVRRSASSVLRHFLLQRSHHPVASIAVHFSLAREDRKFPFSFRPTKITAFCFLLLRVTKITAFLFFQCDKNYSVLFS